MVNKGNLTPVELDARSAQESLALRLRNVEHPYRLILAGNADLDTLKAYCGAVRFALYEYDAYSNRTPGRFDDAAEVLIQATTQVLVVAKSLNRAHGERGAKFSHVINAITHHRDDLKTSLERSRKQQREADARNEAVLANR